MDPAITVDDAILILNRALETDRMAVSELILEHRVACSGALAGDPTIQVNLAGRADDGTGYYEVGVLGILNGLFGVNEDGYGPIVADVHDGQILRFRKYSLDLSQPLDA